MRHRLQMISLLNSLGKTIFSTSKSYTILQWTRYIVTFLIHPQINKVWFSHLIVTRELTMKKYCAGLYSSITSEEKGLVSTASVSGPI